MTDNSQRTLERIAHRAPVPEPAYERLLRRRDRKERNRRLSAAVLAIVLTLLSVTGLMRAFRNSERPATEPTPTVVDRGIFSGMGGWIAFGNDFGSSIGGIWAMDPERRGISVQLSTHGGEPLAWSSDGSKLLIMRGQRSPLRAALYVLNSDGSETLLIDAADRHWLSGGSFSPDGSKVVYADLPSAGWGGGIYVVDADGGTPRRLLEADRLLLEPTFSPDGSQIAYMDGAGDYGNSLRVMNADGSGSRVLLKLVMRNSAFAGGLVWSPDGRRLAFGLGYDPDTIYVVGADGSGPRLIARGENPEWSPDGSRISYDKDLGGVPGPLVIADADGTQIRRFNNASSGPWNPLDRAESGTQDTSGATGATRADWFSYAIAALAAVGIVVLWLRRKGKTRAKVREEIE